MNQKIEFHDSTLTGISQKNGKTILHFDKAYIHHSEGKPGIDNGTGWLQVIDIELADAKIESIPHNFPIDLHHSDIVIDNERILNSLAIPVDRNGEVKLHLKTVSGEELKLSAQHITSIELSEPEYVEDFNV